MKRYIAVNIKHCEGYVSARCDEYDLFLDAADITDAVDGLKQMLDEIGVKMVKNRQEIKYEPDTENDMIIFIETDFEKEYKCRYSNVVRRNVSLPAWLDEDIRNYRLDASKIFQAAVEKELEDRKRIKNTEELRKNIDSKILEDFLREEMEKRFKGEQK